jgi:hypothetical protein
MQTSGSSCRENADVYPHTPSCPAQAGHPVTGDPSAQAETSPKYWIVRRSLSSGGRSADPVADDDSGKLFEI